MLTREEIFEWARQQYGTAEEYPWNDENAVLRRGDSRKWYAVVLKVHASKIGLEEDRMTDVLNVKLDPVLIGSLRGQAGYHPAYHMNKERWISIDLNSAAREDVLSLLNMSYQLVGK